MKIVYTVISVMYNILWQTFTFCDSQIFRELAYKCLEKEEFLAGIDEFMEQVTVLPPGEWDPKIRLEPPSKVPSQVNIYIIDMYDRIK